jgi:tRNA-uridine 2-sulfurtransferase
MSGGVDSSATAALLKDAGHEVVGMTLRVWSHQGTKQQGSCCSLDDVQDARAVAHALGIPFYVADVEELFRERVVGPFVEAYLQGRTPIPCVACNDEVKFGFLLGRARQLGAKLATGHYARVEASRGRHRLLRATDKAKDQSYFLFTLGQRELEDVLFPIGGMEKSEVRAIAAHYGLPTARKAESMEICFVPDGDYAGFVERTAGELPGGDIVTSSGEIVGRHAGIHRFTVGQRRGLKVASREALYVQQIHASNHTVVVGSASEAWREEFSLLAPRWTAGEAPLGRRLEVKIRHRHVPVGCQIHRDGDGGLRVRLEEPQRAVTPGQAAVLYENDEVLGGGWIG